MNATKPTPLRIALSFASFVVFSAAVAGGPALIYDPAAGVPYRWHMDHWPEGVATYVDLGRLGTLSPAVVNTLVDESLEQWNGVTSSTFRFATPGSLFNLNIPDIVCTTPATCNANLVIGAWNGGGIHVIYDNDGTVLEDFLGVEGVDGLTGIEFVAEGSNEILEAWTVLNGPSVPSDGDPLHTPFRGVMSHEFGHAANLADSQVNGAAFAFGDATAPWQCTAPYAGSPSGEQVETMYPIASLLANGNGSGMATVDRMDDIAAISDLYPAPGWPESHGTVRGTISALLRRGIGLGSATDVTGVNVVARNVAHPFDDFNSSISGEGSQGRLGPDGRFEIHGLTPGEAYVLYVERLEQGSFSVPHPLVLPGPEEFYNGAAESGDGLRDDRCDFETIRAGAGAAVTANLVFNRVKGAPEFIPQPTLGSPFDITADGSVVVGKVSNGAYRWNLADDTVVDIGGFGVDGHPAISDDGTKIAYSIVNAQDKVQPAIHEDGAWTLLPLRADAVAPCGATWGEVSDISGDGSTVVGISYGNGCAETNGSIRGFVSKGGVTRVLPKAPDASERANGGIVVNFDGTRIGGRDSGPATSVNRGAYWNAGPDGTPGPANLVELDPTLYAGQTSGVTRDGRYLAGRNHHGFAWRYSSSGIEDFGPAGAGVSAVLAIDDEGDVMLGRSDSFQTLTFFPAIWTSALGWVDLNALKDSQGIYAEDTTIGEATAISADGTTLVGLRYSARGFLGWAMKMPRLLICHASPGHPTQNGTIDVPFPSGLAPHLGHGDTIGLCEQ